jgi:hypothetical protein
MKSNRYLQETETWNKKSHSFIGFLKSRVNLLSKKEEVAFRKRVDGDETRGTYTDWRPEGGRRGRAATEEEEGLAVAAQPFETGEIVRTGRRFVGIRGEIMGNGRSTERAWFLAGETGLPVAAARVRSRLWGNVTVGPWASRRQFRPSSLGP